MATIEVKLIVLSKTWKSVTAWPSVSWSPIDRFFLYNGPKDNLFTALSTKNITENNYYLILSNTPALPRLRLKCDGTDAETRFRLSAKWTSPFKSAWASIQSTTASRGVHISGSNGSNAGYTMFRGSVKGTVYPLHSSVSPSLPLPCVTMCHHISTGLYQYFYLELIGCWSRAKEGGLSPASTTVKVNCKLLSQC